MPLPEEIPFLNRHGLVVGRVSRVQIARERGVALLLVLASLSILTVMIVAFLIGAGKERKTSASYQATVSTQALADMAVNLVEAQITVATTAGSDYAWASQPGAIWTWNSNGDVANIYRLYSWDSMTTKNPRDVATDDAAQMTDWKNAPALWVDLNAPGTSASGDTVYPIVDPGLSGTLDGFSVNNPPGGSGGAPLPVKWLYILRDGAVVSPGGTSPVSIPGASRTNPIVGRIAYWTDDETCKINLNTAGGDNGGATLPMSNGVITDYSSIANATFWDTPHFNTPDELLSGSSQPATGEFQRYPGHPASTSLSHILSSLSGVSLSGTSFYSLTPRYSYGGSQGGTVSVSGGESAIPLKAERLYASVEEILFSANNRAASTVNAQSTASIRKLAQAQFFLTTHSRAPELNLFGKPRVSVWPIYAGSPVFKPTVTQPVITAADRVTATDQLLAFCSTVVTDNSAHPYYFSRSSSISPSTDAGISRNRDLLNYLDALTASDIPGFGGSFDSKYQQKGKRQILTEIFDYIRLINTEDPSPQFPRDADKYPTNVYAAGGSASTASTVAGAGAAVGYGQVTPSVNPMNWGTMGIGSFPLLVEADLQFVGMGQGTVVTSSNTIPAIPLLSATHAKMMKPDGVTPPDQTRAIQAFLLLNFLNPAHSYPWQPQVPFFWVKVTGLDGLKIRTPDSKDTSLGFPSAATAVGGGYKYSALPGPYGMVGCLDFRSMVAQRKLGQNDVKCYPFYGDIMPVAITGAGSDTMEFSGGVITVQIYAPASFASPISNASMASACDDSRLIQTYTLTFPPDVADTTVSFPVPTVAGFRVIGSGSSTVSGTTATSDRWFDLYNSANNLVEAGGTTALITKGQDVVRGIILSGNYYSFGDARILASQTVPTVAFTTHPDYYVKTKYLAHSMNVPGVSIPGATSGKLVSGASYAWDAVPAVPASVSYALNPGDWDNGISSYPDGPYINKTDEGNQASALTGQAAAKVPYFNWYQPAAIGGVYFSPNRQVPSPAILGSLPTGIDPSGVLPKPWQTLLFRPGPSGHEGAASPKDSLLLDLFWMPVTSPYALSEPFSTAGKVNLNYQIAPFSYVTRSTAVRAVLGAEKVAAVGLGSASSYKKANDQTATLGSNARYPLFLGGDSGDDGGVLQQFRNRFAGSGAFKVSSEPSVFKTAAEICDIFLVPKSQRNYAWSTPATAQNQWYGNDFALVGDNVRERPYANIYGRVTTKSNTFKVHYIVQSLKAGKADLAAGQWNENRGVVTGQYRGAATLERYIDTKSNNIPDYGANPGSGNLETYYRWHVVENQQFVP